MKDDQLDKRQIEIDEQDKRINDLQAANSQMEAKLKGVETGFELHKVQAADRIKNLTEVIHNEKETRELWI